MTGSIDPERGSEAVPNVPEDATQKLSARKLAFSRLVARVMAYAGWTGLGFSLLLLISVPLVLHRLSTVISTELGALAGSLREASVRLSAQEKNVAQLDGLLEQGSGLAVEIDSSLTAVTPLLDDMAAFLGDQMPLTLSATESSLRSASEGAAAIDALLRILSRIPFIGSIEYDPGQPLDASLVQAADGLVPLSDPLIELQLDLNEFSLSLKDLQSEIGGSEARLRAVRDKLSKLNESIRAGSDRLTDLAATIESVVARLPIITVALGLFSGFFVVWLMLVNVLLIINGNRWRLELEGT